jgi:uncharacterized membrane protein YcaP (DUF421 family)
LNSAGCARDRVPRVCSLTSVDDEELTVKYAFELLLGLGKEAKDISVLEMGLRAMLVYVVTLAIVRLGKKRFMSRASAFDVIVGIMIGSIASRAITGNAPMVPALGSAAAIVLLHWLFSAMAVRSHRFGNLIKGRSTPLIEDGAVLKDVARRLHMTEHDLLEAIREKGVGSVSRVAEARLERSGEVSVIRRDGAPQVVNIEVSAGVQTVRIEF